MKRSSFARMTAGLVALTCVPALAACGSSGGHGSRPTSAPSSTALPSAPNVASLRSDVVLTRCAGVSGGWQATGTVRNGRTSELGYKLTVYFTTPKATVVGSAQTTVRVGAGKTAPWTAKGAFDAPSGTKCVLVGVAKA